MTYRVNQLFMSFMACLCLSACATNPVFTDSDPQNDFSNYKTFSWAGDKPMYSDSYVNPLSERRITESIKSNLLNKGFHFVENATKADFAVSFSVGTRDKIKIRTESSIDYGRYYESWRWGRHYFPSVQNTVTSQNYTEGSLAIDIFDVSSKSPVWHGSASKKLSKSELQQPTAGIKVAVDTIMASFPPQ